MHKKITSSQHPLVKHLVKIRSQKKAREQSNTLLITGANLVPEICKNTQPIHLLAVNPNDYPNSIEVTKEILAKITGLESATHVAAEVPIPKPGLPKKINRLLVIDQISDPGNLGTLARTALAFGWDALFLIHGTVDLFNDKTIRSAKGAMFRLPYQFGSWDDLNEIEQTHNLNRWIADLNGIDPSSISPSPNHGISLVLGSEAAGPSPQALSKGQKTTLKMPGDMESLNVAVAGGIIMYALIKDNKK